MVDYAARMETLRQIVQNAQNDEDTFWMIQRMATGILTHLGVHEAVARDYIDQQFRNRPIADLAAYEANFHSWLKDSTEGLKRLPARMTDRAYAWYRKLISSDHTGNQILEPGGEILDLGGGSGELARIIHENFNRHSPTDVTIADALDWRKVDLPFLKVEDNKIHINDESFDQTMVVTVFHHSDDPEALVKEAFRVTRKRVVFIESVTQDPLMYQYGSWIDWIYNHGVHHNPDITKKINVPCRFMPSTGWEQLVLRLTGLKPTVSKNLGIFQHLNPEHHWLFAYDKK